MLYNDVSIIWTDTGELKINGENVNAIYIRGNSTIGLRFTGADGWTTQVGRLPGLFGKTVEIPAYIN